ncbi:MAG TPA: VTT domain-containing protein [Candidatus Paceibacterota bacterium]|nr:VTT domain-containing protein [Candidatus Paceibacterota bacterium]
MEHFSFLYNFIDGSVGSTIALSFTIILGTFFLEDPTTIIVGMLAADGSIPISTALFSLYAGIVFGDIGIYSFGWLASTSPRLARYVDHDFIAPFRTWLETRYILTIFSARFIPGARLPTYASSGFFRSPLSTFILVAIVATSIWTTLLFSASYWFGSLTAEWMGPLRWGIAALFLIFLFFIGRHNVLAYRDKREEQRNARPTLEH